MTGGDPQPRGAAPWPAPRVAADASAGDAVEALWDLTRLLRTACPWDREQTATTIVPHTVEEAWEVAAAARHAETDAAAGVPELVDELGDLLFQVTFLAMWCDEQQSGSDLREVAASVVDKLVRRHPHVFGTDAEARSADDVRRTWDDVKRDVEGRDERTASVLGDTSGRSPVGEARKLQARAAKVGFDFVTALEAVDALEAEVVELREAISRAGDRASSSEDAPPDADVEWELGDVLFAAANVARKVRVDPEFAVQGAGERFRARVDGAVAAAGAAGEVWTELDLERQEHWYQVAKRELADVQ